MKKYKLFHYDGEEIGWVELTDEEANSLDGLDIPLWCLNTKWTDITVQDRSIPGTDLVFIMDEC
jgi:hypothetical protein